MVGSRLRQRGRERDNSEQKRTEPDAAFFFGRKRSTLPTPESPITKSLNMRSYVVDVIVFVVGPLPCVCVCEVAV